MPRNNREILKTWIVDAIRENGSSANIVQVCKYIWENHHRELEDMGDIFYTWHYDVRWAGQQ